MSKITFTERIRKSGSSKVIPITKHVDQSQFKEGDEVTVSIGEPDEEEEYSMMIGRLFSNPNAFYRNVSYLTPQDKMANGQRIEDLSDRIPEDTKTKIVTTLDAMTEIYKLIDTSIRFSDVCGEYAWYSDTQRSFIVKFNPYLDDDFLLSPRYDLYKAAKILNIIGNILTSSLFMKCPLKNVSELVEKVAEAEGDLELVYDIEDPEMLEQKIEEINLFYDNKLQRAVSYYYVGLVTIYPNTFSGDHFGPCAVTIPMVKEPFEPFAYRKMDTLVEKHIEENKDLEGYESEITMLGPFPDKPTAAKVQDYLKMSWDLYNGPNDARSVKIWAKEQSKLIREKYEKKGGKQ